MSMVDSRGFEAPRNVVRRKPLPPAPTSVAPGMQSRPDFQPDQAYLPRTQQQPQHHPQQQQQQQLQPQPPQEYSHARSRTASSSTFPLVPVAGPQQQQPQVPPKHPHVPPKPHAYQNENRMPQTGQAPQQLNHPVRTASTATDSTSSTSTYEGQRNFSGNVPMRQNSAASSSLQRTSSSQSGNSASSYVAMMRKQKATVWSDRAQYEDPRLKNQQRLAKIHARAEMSGATSAGGRASSGSSSLTGGVRSKIRHHGAPKAQQYAPGVMSAGGVPIRLSQNEIEEDDSEDGSQPGATLHRRTDSGRSSLGSAGRTANAFGLHGQSAPVGVYNAQISPDSNQGGFGSADETPVPDHFRGQDYFSTTQQQQQSQQQQSKSVLERAGSGGSGSTDRENSFGQAGTLPLRVQADQDDTLDPAELRRRGSVDERTMTMSGYGKLFVANPDVDD